MQLLNILMWSDGYIQNHYKHVYHIHRVSIQSNVSVSGFLMGVFLYSYNWKYGLDGT